MDHLAADDRGDPAAGGIREPIGLDDRASLVAGMGHDGLAERVLRPRFGGGGGIQDLVGRDACCVSRRPG
ncbi:hypothetical protein ACETK8_10720 [Brevundimonas staleyi]|uniref:Uncharacterized protein n=1 Tax=Brevundimonas staleyi TaxID=74326 RepID=A0ABW0FQM6_9CAUL|nr:hypothetical protein [Brevundimonas diminuta]MDM8353489.1 hypothetical protein [Brevundimonas diminuta]